MMAVCSDGGLMMRSLVAHSSLLNGIGIAALTSHAIIL